MSEARASRPALEFKGRMMTLTILRLLNDAVDVLARELDRRIKGAPGFFRHLPVVIDVTEVADSDLFLDLPGLAELLRTRDLVPVGIRGGDERWADAADVAGLSVFPPEAPPMRRPSEPQNSAGAAAGAAAAGTAGAGGASSAGAPAAASAQTAAAAAAPTQAAGRAMGAPVSQGGRANGARAVQTAQAGTAQPAPPGMPQIDQISGAGLIVTTPVRSGQQVYARGGDLIVLAPVSPGAELLADGHIHVYGTLNGRALAGVRGDTHARIFCRSFRAELVSVAGVYSIHEQFSDGLAGKPAQVSLDGDKLRVESL